MEHYKNIHICLTFSEYSKNMRQGKRQREHSISIVEPESLLSADDLGRTTQIITYLNIFLIAAANSVENEILKYMITNKKLFSKVLSALEDVGGKVDILTERVQQLTNNIPEEVILAKRWNLLQRSNQEDHVKDVN
ncbi:hypothetical protein NQ317_005580 [Molorchus minor]|uniref:Uncharacterized protein n=1 Tax=Molorchus minor TaxID=1323400 RepID=A0ABQ9K691_9CUCU|nr:hypothetical protein NQ317_005580 [Molorchus minor]